MKNMRAILVNQDARVVVMVIGIARDVGAAVHEQDLFAGASGEALRQNAPCVPGSHN
jgi:hypothetical protein